MFLRIRYSYVQNNPIKFIDPKGKDLILTGPDAEYLRFELETQTGYKLNRDQKTGRVTIDRSVKRKGEGTSAHLAEKVSAIVGAAELAKSRQVNQPGMVGDAFLLREMDMSGYDNYNKADPKFGAGLIAQVLEEYYTAAKMSGPYSHQSLFTEGHKAGNNSRVLSSRSLRMVGKPREDRIVNQTIVNQSTVDVTVRFDYSRFLCHGNNDLTPRITFVGTVRRLVRDTGIVSGQLAIYRLASYKIEQLYEGEYPKTEMVVSPDTYRQRTRWLKSW